VGLEHIESGDIHLRRSAPIEDETTFTKRFSEGDVLFGRRRAYLKKAAQATFSGICSGDITVLRAKSSLVPSLLPFIILNDKFFDWAITHSAGGLSPRVKFKDLANYQLLLPPIEEQSRLADLLWAIDEVVESELNVLERLEKDDLSYLKHFFYDDKSSLRVKLKNIVSIKKGKQPPILLPTGDGLPYCNAKYLRTGEVESVVPEEAWSKSIKINEYDILILWDGSNAGEMLLGKEGFLASTMCKLEIKNVNYLKEFVFHFLRFKSKDIKRATIGSAIPHVDTGMIENIEIPSLKLVDQEAIVDLFVSLKTNIELLNDKISNSKKLQKSLINQIF